MAADWEAQRGDLQREGWLATSSFPTPPNARQGSQSAIEAHGWQKGGDFPSTMSPWRESALESARERGLGSRSLINRLGVELRGAVFEVRSPETPT